MNWKKENFCNIINGFLTKALQKGGTLEISPDRTVALVLPQVHNFSITSQYFFECLKIGEEEGLVFQKLTVEQRGLRRVVKLIFKEGDGNA